LPVLVVPDPRALLGQVSAWVYGNPVAAAGRPGAGAGDSRRGRGGRQLRDKMPQKRQAPISRPVT
ncbi:hypothetical protein, partial [Streptosporangium sp. NPDC048865]|uniref:hypothetical protein n=1 Tax=Streptosporangium sp. NPDC048865 TaxID=3155766 RepID=UPI0034134DEE